MESLAYGDVFLRLGAAVAAGALIGLNRELRRKPAGLRTLALVSLGSAIFILETVDPTRAFIDASIGSCRASLVGSDNAAVEITPNPDRQLAGPVHQILRVINGIHVLENLRLDALAARQVYEFALIVEPLKIQGGTGSTVAPIAIQ